MTVKKGDFVQVIAEKLTNSLESQASDPRFPSYIFEGRGEIVDIKDDYAQIKFPVPTPTIWLRLDQVEAGK
ncbi:NAD(P)H-quinone oxidoreductase subunit O [Thermosynechococcaceae cyanobacterium BACA0444]|uniref:NAD(P)H-quinone oxidoreductase subunit O n=1 Tax=Pseudocalidococcus azoricus BACA0444 TaxID=2918990 RepID=A0AAE4FUX7_9CYAN|nr:NAD(P)H-quinone oxidoreductase subunit O [Pseudocalidococcus azoricus]MDS3861340.1 NAD(P)H-quinone oxidoreductase subunit O [Pseudocalidococcus azoricus BACA0444]